MVGYDPLHLEFLESHIIDCPSTCKKYIKFNQSLSKIFQMLQQRNLLKLRKLKSLPNPLPPQINPNLYCDYHQMPWHTTDECHAITYIVQDLIDSGKLEDLEKIPNVKTSPSPKYQDVPRTKNKPAQFSYPAISQPPPKMGIIPSGSHEYYKGNRALASQTPPTYWAPTFDHHKREKQKRTLETCPHEKVVLKQLE